MTRQFSREKHARKGEAGGPPKRAAGHAKAAREMELGGEGRELRGSCEEGARAAAYIERDAARVGTELSRLITARLLAFGREQRVREEREQRRPEGQQLGGALAVR